MRTTLCLTTAALLAWALPLQAADTPAPPPPRPAAATPAAPPADPLGAARARVAAQDWPGALSALQAARDERSADWHNLMGFALRSQATPDYPAAERHYNEALRINPAHRGALEYAGELYLKTNRRALAEAQLAALARACPGGCPELDDLKAALARTRP
jgi:tetratricopeptide (TPR) repeat protein